MMSTQPDQSDSYRFVSVCWEKQSDLWQKILGGLFVSWGTTNQVAEITGMYGLAVLEAICPGSRCPWGWFLLRVEREECVPCLPPIFWWLASNPGHSLACGSITSSLPASSRVLPGCVSVSKFPPLYRDRSLLDSVQFSCSAMSNSLWPHGLQQARPPCPTPTYWIRDPHTPIWASLVAAW